MWKKIWKWCLDEDWIVVAIPALILIVLLAISQLWYWLGLFTVVIAAVLGFEILATKNTGLSISDQFRTWKKDHPMLARSILIAAALFFTSLIFHLSANLNYYFKLVR